MGKSKDLATGNSAAYVETAGDTMTGTLNVNGGNFYLAPDNAAAHRYMYLNTATSNDGHIILQRALSNKHQLTTKPDNSFNIYGYDASGDVFNIDSSGRVTTPKQPQFVLQGYYNNWTTINQSGQWLPLTGSAAVATSTNNELAMNWTSSRAGGYNPSGSGFNASNGIYTAPVNGTYMFTFQSYILKGAAGTGYIHINSFINGSNQEDYTIYGYNSNASAYVQPELKKVIRMSANDTFAFRLYTNVTDYMMFPHYTLLTGYLLG